MNPRQRRGVILLGLALLGGFAVFFSVLTFIADVDAKVGNLVTVVELTKATQAYSAISTEDLALREVPKKWTSDSSITDARDVVGLVSTTDLPAGTYAQRGMFVERPGVANGYREVAILVDAETGVAGKISSGDRVDILATSEDPQLKSRRAEVWVANALIIDVGVAETVEERKENGFGSGKAVPVTFALPVNQALKVAYAESFATKVRLALRGGGDQSSVPAKDQLFSLGGAS